MPNKSRFESRHRGRKKYVPVFFSIILIVAITYYTYNQLNGQLFKKNVAQSLNNKEAGALLKRGNAKGTGIEHNKKIDRYLRKIQFNGTAMIVKDGKIILNKGYGLANQTNNQYNNPNTDFYIGSITKSIVATAFMQLQQAGKVNVNEPLSNYLPAFPHAREIKLYHLLTHTSGIPVRNEFGGKLTIQDLIENIGQTAQHLKAKPGTKWGYSDSNYAVLGYIVERVSGIPLHEYIKKHIFNVAGMDQSGFGNDMKKEHFPSTGYKVNMGITYTPHRPDFTQVYGCGDIYSTAYDLYKFDRALESGKLVSKESYKNIFTPHNLANYGYGWYINRKGWYIKPGNYSSHGVLPGWNGFNSFSMDGKVYIVLLSNLQNNIKSYASVSKKLYEQVKNTNSKIL